MKATELIKLLQDKVNEHGDLDVTMRLEYLGETAHLESEEKLKVEYIETGTIHLVKAD